MQWLIKYNLLWWTFVCEKRNVYLCVYLFFSQSFLYVFLSKCHVFIDEVASEGSANLYIIYLVKGWIE